MNLRAHNPHAIFTFNQPDPANHLLLRVSRDNRHI